MSTKKLKIPPHSDQNFVLGLKLYLSADQITKTSSWEEMFDKIEKSIGGEAIKSLLFNQFKALHFIILIEHSLCSFFSHCHENEVFKEHKKAKKMVVRQIERFRGASEEEAKGMLKKENYSENPNIWTPHILLFVAGFSLGNFIDLIRGHTKNFSEKKELLEKLTELNENRNMIFHKSTSSRINLQSKMEEFLEIAQECLAILNKFLPSI